MRVPPEVVAALQLMFSGGVTGAVIDMGAPGWMCGTLAAATLCWAVIFSETIRVPKTKKEREN